MRATFALSLVLVLFLSACGSKKSERGDESDDSDKWSAANVKREDNSNRSSSSGSDNSNTSDSGKNNSGNDAANKPEPPKETPEPAPEIVDPFARADIEGKVTEFNHVIALWDEPNHSVRFIASTENIPAEQYPRLRNGEPLGGEVPHIVFSFVLQENTTSMTKAKVENWFYDFHWLTSLSPVSLRNIGKESITEMSGKVVVGDTIRLQISFESAKVKDAPEGKFDFEVQFDLVLE